MINLLGLCLVISTLVSAGVWSPTPQKTNTEQEEVIVKDGHRAVVVEYDQQGQHNTKVSISPEHDYHSIPKPPSSPSLEEKISSAASDALDNTKDKIKEASSVLPNLGQGLSQDQYYVPGELICDTYGICKHEVTGAIGKTKDKVSEKAHGVAHEAKEKVKEAAHETAAYQEKMAYEAKEKMQDMFSKAKEGASHKAHDIKEDVKEGAKESMAKVKETAAETADNVKEGAKESLSKAKEAAKEAKDTGKTLRGDVAHNVSKQVGRVRDCVKEGSEEAAKRVKSSLNQVLDETGQIFIGLMRYLGLPVAMDALMGVTNLLGFAMAYGMCVWVTFISSYVLAGTLPRQQFGIVQSKMHPVYFRAMASSIGLALLGHTPRLFGTKADMFQGANLLGSVLMVLANSMYLEPRATKVMFERMKVMKEEGRGIGGIVPESSRAAETTTTTATDPAVDTTTRVTRPQENPEQEVIRSNLTRLGERLKELNTYSSILNILTLMSLSWHLVYLAQRLHMVC